MGRRIGILVNPDAGLGGRLGFKGSDGRAAEARAAGAEDRSGPRMRQALERCQNRLEGVEILTCSGRMGSDWIPMEHSVVFETPELTSAETTRDAVKTLCEAGIELLLYAGGDGTTRDIIEALNESELPVIGVPGGVKMHSGCFAATPRAAAEVVNAKLPTGEIEVFIKEIEILSKAATPTALFAIGINLYNKINNISYKDVVYISNVKLIIHPLLVFIIFYYFNLNVPELWIKVAILCASLPIAGNVFAMSIYYNCFTKNTSSSILITTILSTFTVPFILYLLLNKF